MYTAAQIIRVHPGLYLSRSKHRWSCIAGCWNGARRIQQSTGAASQGVGMELDGYSKAQPLAPVLPVGARALCSPPETFDVTSRYKEQPWEYLKSTEYLERYGENRVWANYRRNHKGPIPPQKTRKMCIRRGKTCGNPCPICRDQKLIVDFRNVKLIEQFICPHTGVVYDPTRTGVCMTQYKRLVKAITDAQDHGLLPVIIPHKDVTFGDYSCNHGAVAQTPPRPEGPWYPWYEWQEPPSRDVVRLRKMYRPYLKKMMGDE